jgi:hypothetical protein
MASRGFLGDPGPTMPLTPEARIHHDDRPPGALAHGAVKTSDIERVRGDVAAAERRVAVTAPAALARGARATSRRAELEVRASPPPQSGDRRRVSRIAPVARESDRVSARSAVVG